MEYQEKITKNKIETFADKFSRKKEKLVACRKDRDSLMKAANKERILIKEISKMLKNSIINEKVI